MSAGRSEPGTSRCPEISYQELLAKESQTETIPDTLLEESYEYLGSDELPTDRYISPAFHSLEVDRMWSRVWQMTCRLEDIPNVGDYIVYDIVDWSVIVVRVSAERIKAYHNSCLHRANQLCTQDGKARRFKCSFHGWTYDLEGKLSYLPAEWDFPFIDQKSCSLPECRVDVWEGFVFINIDLDAPPLEDYLGVLPDHFVNWPHERRVKVAHVAGVVELNWKATMEAFFEGYHGWATHPTTSYWTGDQNSQYDFYGDHVSRYINPMGIQSPALRKQLTEQEIARAGARELGYDDAGSITVPEGSTARQVLTQRARAEMSRMTGLDLSAVSTTDIIDPKQYFIFPNFVPWGGWAAPLGYRFRPNGNDCQSCIAELMIFADFAEGVPKPPAAKVRWLTGSDWTEAPELGALANFFNQDMVNFPKLRKGLRAASVTPGRNGLKLADYQEVRIRHFHRTLMKYLEA